MRNWLLGRTGQEPVTPRRPGPYVPEVFEHNVISHIYSNALFPEQAPVLLLVVGDPGIGKTFQIRSTCSHWGIHCELASGATFQGDEGQSQKKLNRAYTKAVQGVFDEREVPYGKPKRQAVLLIDDFHLSLASVMSDNFSQNSQIFMAALMSGCDDPRTLHNISDGVPYIRVPIIATANSVKEVYGPILRHGRARLFHWEPSLEDRRYIALDHLSRLGREDTEQLADKFKGETPVFFRELVNRVLETQIVAVMKNGVSPTRESVLTSARALAKGEIERIAAEVKKSELLKAIKLGG